MDTIPGERSSKPCERFYDALKTLQQPPEEAGYDEPAWTSKLARQHLIEEYDIAYSLRYVQRLMKKAEVSWKKPRPEPSSADEEELNQYDEEVKKSRET